MNQTTCPCCHDDAPTYLGTLGRLAHFRCRSCGMDFHKDAELYEHLTIDLSLPDDGNVFA